AERDPAKQVERGPRRLPGLQEDGFVLLPTQWSIKPVGTHIELGDFPVNIAVHPAGEYVAVLHAGYGEHEIIVINVVRQRITARVSLDQTFYGLTFTPDGKTLLASGCEFEVVHAYEFDDGLLARHRSLPVAAPKDTFVVGGIATDRAGKT